MADEPRRRPPPAARRFNLVAVRFSGRWYAPRWVRLEHRGRRSGRAYSTPLALVATRGTDLIIGLPWGRRTDWLRNLQSGGGEVTWRGATAEVVGVDFVGVEEVLPLASRPIRAILVRSGLTDFIALHRGPRRSEHADP
ncbi:hypothetical protein [Nocardioides insulae]|uniref:hypothetical protein n=1 Tax=Nocardioides insulae TaxID=394734 RepID=UPI000687D323|nr:hypothetical protein [Nocardioides insulae]